MAKRETIINGIVYPAGFSPESAIDAILTLENILEANPNDARLTAVKLELADLFKLIDNHT